MPLTVHDLFPLTPALSLRERGNRSQRRDKSRAVAFSKDWIRFTLSLRERAGVRGKG